MSRTLYCEIGKHEFQHPGGRGRPPKNCSEHAPVKPGKKNVTVVTDVTDAGVSDNPFIKKATAANNPFVKRAEEAQKEADKKKMEDVRAGKAEKREASAKEQAERIEKEYLEIDDRIEQADAEYKEAFEAACKIEWSYETEKEFNRAWSKADKRQNALANCCARKRELEKLVELITNPTNGKPTLEDFANVVAPLAEDHVDKVDKPRRRPGPAVDVTETPIRAITDAAMDESAAMEQYEDENEELGYNDLLSNPEQYDDPDEDDVAEQFAHILEQFDD